MPAGPRSSCGLKWNLYLIYSLSSGQEYFKKKKKTNSSVAGPLVKDLHAPVTLLLTHVPEECKISVTLILCPLSQWHQWIVQTCSVGLVHDLAKSQPSLEGIRR